MTLKGRTIARLAAPFDGGSGPSHGVIERIWASEDALDYLPEGNKADRVLGGLKSLRDGRRADGLSAALPPDRAKLRRVAAELAEKLLVAGLVSEDDVAEALDPAETPTSEPPPAEAKTAVQTGSTPNPTPTVVSPAGPIFVVHGRDRALLSETVRMLERASSREVIVLHEQPNAGRTILEKFEAHAASASYAVVLLTGDDVGGVAGKTTSPRGRQNVIFELGFFFGKLGRDRVAVLLGSGVEQPSDINGLLYIPVDEAGAWKYRLGRELQSAGIDVALDRIP
jgi:predicted nucleotide-binding protein